MRPTILASALLAIGLLLMPAAAADNSGGHSEKGQLSASAHRANEPADVADHADTTSHEKGHMAAFVDGWHALMASWHENATKIRDGCHAEPKPGENATHEARVGWAHCIRDGYHKFLDQHRSERAGARAAKHSR